MELTQPVQLELLEPAPQIRGQIPTTLHILMGNMPTVGEWLVVQGVTTADGTPAVFRVAEKVTRLSPAGKVSGVMLLIAHAHDGPPHAKTMH